MGSVCRPNSAETPSLPWVTGASLRPSKQPPCCPSTGKAVLTPVPCRLRAAAPSGADRSRPNDRVQGLGSHPAALPIVAPHERTVKAEARGADASSHPAPRPKP